MSYDNKRQPAMPHVVRFISTAMLACATLLCAPAAHAIDSGDIVVVSSKGEVHITLNGVERNVRAGSALVPPATVRTGRDGNVELKQGATTVSVGPDTLLDFPALEKPGAPIDRIVQPSGNAFYSIGKREGRKLRVETPYLVGVIKGTQFNVAAEKGLTTISLFEGLLEVHAADESDVVDLKAGEIASRKQGDKTINIVKMDAGKAPATIPRPAPASGSNSSTPGATVPRVTPSSEGGDSLVRADVDLNTGIRPSGSSVETGTAVSVSPGRDIDAGANVVVAVTPGPGVDVGTDTSVSVGNSVDLGANTTVSVGPAGVDVGASVGVDAGPAAIDAGVGAAVDAAAGTVDVSTGVNVDAGPVTADLGTSTSVDVGAGAVAIDTSVSTVVDAGPLTTDIATDAAVGLPSGTVDAAVTVGASAPLVQVDVGATAAVDAVAGTVNLGLDVLGTDINLGVDLGLDDGNKGNGSDSSGSDSSNSGTGSGNSGPGSDNSGPGNTNLGNLLDGLLRRPGRK
jgi:hypothetical protein